MSLQRKYPWDYDIDCDDDPDTDSDTDPEGCFISLRCARQAKATHFRHGRLLGFCGRLTIPAKWLAGCCIVGELKPIII